MKVAKRLACRKVVVTAGCVSVLALLLVIGLHTAFAGYDHSDFRQCANDDGTPYTTGDCHWIGSIVQQNNSLYYEGMSVLQRLIFTGIDPQPGDAHTLVFSHQATKGGIHAYDFLTSYAQAEATASLAGVPYNDLAGQACGDEIGPPGDLGTTCQSLRDGMYCVDVDVPDDPFISTDGSTQDRIDAYESAYGNRTVRICGDQAITAASMTLSHDVANGGDTGDSEIEYELSWTSASTATLIEMGGHIALSGDPAVNGIAWGVGLGASNISGGPYHFHLQSLDDDSTGSQDNPIKGADIIIAPGTIIVDKVTDPPQDPASFGFTLTGGPDSIDVSFSLTDTDPPYDSGNLAPGTYVVTETTIPAGWDLTSATCSDGTNPYDPASIELGAGQTVTCTFNDSRQPSYLTLEKTVVNDNGGTAVASDFQARIDGGAVDWGVAYEVDPNVQHTASEDGVAGYAASTWGGDCAADGTITLLPGESKTCTITNDDIGPTLTLVKTVTNNNGGTAVAGDFQAYIDTGAVNWSQAYTLSAGSHTASEDVVAGYSASDWSGDCASDGSITLGLDEDATCYITNDDIGPTLTLVKTVTNDDGGTAVAGDFQAYIDAGAVNWSQAYTLNAGSHTASEDVVAGYSASDWSGDCASDGSITLGLDEDATCYITNDDQPAYLTVIKHVVNDDGWSAVASDFTMTINGVTVPGGATFAGAESPGVTRQVYPGSYNVTEIGPVQYAASYSADCTSSIALGESKTCTVTNDDLDISIDIEKHTNGQDADSPTGPKLHVGDPVTWEYIVTNTGDVTLTNVQVTDSKGVTVTCPKSVLAPLEWMICTANGVVGAEGQYVNQGTASGEYETLTTSDNDLSHHYGLDPCIELTKLGPTGAEVGDKITYVFRVKNCSELTPLDDVEVVDPRFPGMGTKYLGHLDPGQTKTFTYVYTVKESDQPEIINTATATGEDELEKVVDDDDSWIVPIRVGENGEEFVPEPGTVALLGSGLATLAGYASLRRRKK